MPFGSTILSVIGGGLSGVPVNSKFTDADLDTQVLISMRKL